MLAKAASISRLVLALRTPRSPAIIDLNVTAVCPPKLLEFVLKRFNTGTPIHVAFGEYRKHTDLSLLMNATDPETGQSMTAMDVRDNLLTFITARHETTALALTWTLYLLSLHPEVEWRVKREIAAATGGGPVRPTHIDARIRSYRKRCASILPRH